MNQFFVSHFRKNIYCGMLGILLFQFYTVRSVDQAFRCINQSNVLKKTAVEIVADVNREKINAIRRLIETDFASTFTILAAQSLCAAVPITTVTTITQPGTYCLANDIAQDGDLITIASSNVVLDLNGYTLSPISNNAITIDSSEPRSNITVKNGILDGMTVGFSGIVLDANATNTHQDIMFTNLVINNFNSAALNISNVQNCTVEKCSAMIDSISDVNGLANLTFNNCTELTIDSSISYSCVLGDGLDLNLCSNVVIKDSMFNNNQGALGIYMNACANVVLENIICSQNVDVGTYITGGTQNVIFEAVVCAQNGSRGTEITGASQDIFMQNCQMYANQSEGVFIRSSSSNIYLKDSSCDFNDVGVYANVATNIILENVICNKNNSLGIVIRTVSGLKASESVFNNNAISGVSDATGTASQDIIFEGCSFDNNVFNGVSFSNTLNVSMINCTANLNGIHGYNFIDTSALNSYFLNGCQATNNIGNGFELSAPNGNLVNCNASKNVIGFHLSLLCAAQLTECMSNYNTNHGFDFLSINPGVKGLVKSCTASQNGGCGFNDSPLSAYTYISCAAQGNGATPADSTMDSNYCTSSFTSTFVSPSGPGSAPYFQWARNTDGTFFGVSYWDNVTLL